jgi:hypothetical protein
MIIASNKKNKKTRIQEKSIYKKEMSKEEGTLRNGSSEHVSTKG